MVKTTQYVSLIGGFVYDTVWIMYKVIFIQFPENKHVVLIIWMMDDARTLRWHFTYCVGNKGLFVKFY